VPNQAVIPWVPRADMYPSMSACQLPEFHRPAFHGSAHACSSRKMRGFPNWSAKYPAGVPGWAIRAMNGGDVGFAVAVAVARPAVAHASGGGPDSCCCCGHWKCLRHVRPGLKVGAAGADTVTTAGLSAVAVAVAVAGDAVTITGPGGCWPMNPGRRNRCSHVRPGMAAGTGTGGGGDARTSTPTAPQASLVMVSVRVTLPPAAIVAPDRFDAPDAALTSSSNCLVPEV